MRPSFLLLFTVLSLLMPGLARAQAGSGAIEFSAGWAGWTGGLGTIEAGPLFQAALWNHAEESFKIGISGSYARTGVEGSENDVSDLGVGIKARRSLGQRTGAQLYGEAYVGWSRLSVDYSGSDVALHENGFSVGPGAGFSVPISSSLRLHLGGGFHWHRYSNLYLGEGPVIGDGSDSGWRWNGMAGIQWTSGP
jgi:hypothetical protein